LTAWLDETEKTAEFFLSVVTIHEIERGIILLERKGATARASGLRQWMDGLYSLGRAAGLSLRTLGLPFPRQ